MKFIYLQWDPSILKKLSTLHQLQSLFDYLLMRLGGSAEDSLRVMRQWQKEGIIDTEVDLDQFVRDLLDRRLIEQDQKGRHHLSIKGERHLRENAFEEIFKRVKPGGRGDHPAARGESATPDPLPERKPFEYGDDPSHIDYTSSLFNSIHRSGMFDMQMKEEDLEVIEREQSTGCANVLLIDISHSMILYGEDRITPAKQVAMAFAELILRRYPKDELNVILFGDNAVEVPLRKLPYIQVGPYHTNTRAGLQTARRLLGRKKQINKQIFMITDGKPSMIIFPNGEIYKNSFGLDPKIVNKTLDEALLCRKKGIDITTFMITEDPTLVEFVERLTELNQGRAFYSSVDNLGRFLLTSYVANRRRFSS